MAEPSTYQIVPYFTIKIAERGEHARSGCHASRWANDSSTLRMPRKRIAGVLEVRMRARPQGVTEFAQPPLMSSLQTSNKGLRTSQLGQARPGSSHIRAAREMTTFGVSKGTAKAWILFVSP